MKALSNLVGVIAVALFVPLTLALGQDWLTGMATRATPSALLLALSGLCAIALVLAMTGWLLTMAVLVRVLRGPGTVGWCSPAQCSNFASWAGWDWKFYSTNGWQEGIRVMGLELAFQGTVTLPAPTPSAAV